MFRTITVGLDASLLSARPVVMNPIRLFASKQVGKQVGNYASKPKYIRQNHRNNVIKVFDNVPRIRIGVDNCRSTSGKRIRTPKVAPKQKKEPEVTFWHP